MRLRILEPCHEDWTQMHDVGDRRRFCVGCQKQVLDLVGLGEVAARALVGAELREGPVCIRLAIDERGEARFVPQTVTNPHWHRMAFVAGLVLATLSACADPEPDTVTTDGCTYVVGPRTFSLARGEGTCPAGDAPGSRANDIVLGGYDRNIIRNAERERLLAAQAELVHLQAAQAELVHKLGGYPGDPSEREKLVAETAKLEAALERMREDL